MVPRGFHRSAAFPAVVSVLLLLHLSLGITYVVADECGTRFIDPTSSTFIAQVVVQGSVDSMSPASQNSQVHSANLTIAKVYKGMDVLRGMGIPVQGSVMVDKFGPETDPDECVAAMSFMTADQDHMFFLRPTSSSRVLEMTALPLPADTSLTRTVEESLCDTCVSAPEIQRVMCRQCARAPVIRKGKARKVRKGQKARLGCYAGGKPPPRFSWMKSGLPVTSGSGGITIRSTNTSTVLIIRKTKDSHRGQYICKAENEIGESERVILLEFHKKPPSVKPKYNVRNAPDKRVCDRAVCLNGGTCYYSPSLDLSFCKCSKGFEGVKCENEISVAETPSTSFENVSHANANVSTTDRANPQTTPSSPQNATRRLEENTPLVSEFSSTEELDVLTSPVQTTEPEGQGMLTSGGNVPPTGTTFQTSGPRNINRTSRNNPTTRRRYSNVDGEALKIILSRIASKDLESSQCSQLFNDFCENGATCRYVGALGVAVCLCPTGYSGSTCEIPEQQTGSLKHSLTSVEGLPTDTTKISTETTDASIVATNAPIVTTNPPIMTTNASIMTIKDSTGGKLRLGAGGASSGRSSQSPRKAKSTKRRPVDVTSYSKLDDNTLNMILSGLRNRRLKAGRCKSKHFCMNNGKCRYVHKLAVRVCLCRNGYSGQRCEHLQP